MVLRPVKLFGCCPRSVAIAPVDIVHSNQDQVKWFRRVLHGKFTPWCLWGLEGRVLSSAIA